MQYCKSRFGYRVAYPVSVFFLYIIQVPKCNNRKREIPRGEKMMKGMKLVPEEREKEIHIYDGASINIKNKKKKKGKRFFILFFPVVQRIGRGSPKGTATTTTRTLRVSSFSQSIFFLAFRSCLKIWKKRDEVIWSPCAAPDLWRGLAVWFVSFFLLSSSGRIFQKQPSSRCFLQGGYSASFLPHAIKLDTVLCL